ncbi:MAG: sigma-54 dependent transcriptional regulator [Planctomycetaceae bacterium]|jgi:two-component system NtrC family response regulator|nr:sigma-54 dependent transcriptional regulator [Planctomycetaceae bacterium]
MDTPFADNSENWCRTASPKETAQNVRLLLGDSPAMQTIYKLIDRVAPTDSTVVILGETGTGKELAAREIHNRSKRSGKPFVALNCGALPENLIESELFGHRKGSFTGADASRAGLLEAANGGTLFLDEIGELPKGVQAKLLRFLESGEVRRIGENTAAVCNVRVVCATLRHLETMVQNSEFREDLWFRINTFEIHLPPLKDRKEDIPQLITHFAGRFRNELTAKTAEEIFTPEAYRFLLDYDFPGNVRQLANIIEHSLILADDLPIDTVDLPRTLQRPVKQQDVCSVPKPAPVYKPSRPVVNKNVQDSSVILPAATGPLAALMAFEPVPNALTLQELEMQAIDTALQRHGGSKPKAAEELGISIKTLYNKLNQVERRSA